MFAPPPLDVLLAALPEPDDAPLFSAIERIAAAKTPDPYRDLLVHDSHMTVMLEQHHNSPVAVDVAHSHQTEGLYFRKITLRTVSTDEAVLFALVRFDLTMVDAGVRHDIETEKSPLGRVLIEHNVYRQVERGPMLLLTAADALTRYMPMQIGDRTYGRLATLFCNGAPAIDVLEMPRPEV